MFYLQNRILESKPPSFLLVLMVVTAVAFFGSFFGNPGKAFAQGASIAISPLVFELSGEPGDSIENIVKVLNPSENTSIDVEMQFEIISPTGEEGQVTAMSPEEEDLLSIARWIEADPIEFSLEPGEEQIVRFTVNIPEEVEPGGHYAAILARTGSASGPEQTGVGFVSRIGALVLLTVPGEMIEDLSITDFDTGMYVDQNSGSDPVFKPQTYFEYGPVPFGIRFENQGTVHLKPNALVTITNFLGRKVAEIPVEQRNVLPNSARRLTVEWDEDWLWGGRYTATLSGTYGRTNGQLSPETLVFWAFPWKVGLVILIVLILFLLTRKRWAAALRVLLKGDNSQSNGGYDSDGDSGQLKGSQKRNSSKDHSEEGPKPMEK